MGAVHQPPQPTPCPWCGYPRYDLEKNCPGCEQGDPEEYFGGRDAQGRFSNGNVRVLPSVPSSHLLDLQEATDSLVKAARAYRVDGDPIMKDSMIRALGRASAAAQGLIIDKEGPR